MGTWSYICKGGCGKPISEGEDVVGIANAVYAGYGKVGHEESEQAVYHRACFTRILMGSVGDPMQLTDFEPGESDPDQGCGYPGARFVPEGTVLYDPAFDALKGATKVGLVVDFSGSSPLLHADVDNGTRQVVNLVDQALHYLGPTEIELVRFSDIAEAETLPNDGNALYRSLVYEPAREGLPLGGAIGGGDNVKGALDLAKQQGCDAVVVVSDGYHSSWPEEFDLPTVHVLLVDDERELNKMQEIVPEWVRAQTRARYHIPLTDDERDAIEARVDAEFESDSRVDKS